MLSHARLLTALGHTNHLWNHSRHTICAAQTGHETKRDERTPSRRIWIHRRPLGRCPICVGNRGACCCFGCFIIDGLVAGGNVQAVRSSVAGRIVLQRASLAVYRCPYANSFLCAHSTLFPFHSSSPSSPASHKTLPTSPNPHRRVSTSRFRRRFCR